MSGTWFISYLTLWILVVLLAIIVLGLVRQLGIIYLRLGPDQNLLATTGGLELGKPAPNFEAYEITHTRRITLDDLKGKSCILVFVSPSCSPCKELMPHLKEFQQSWNGKINLVIFCQGDIQLSKDFIDSYNLRSALIIDKDGKLSETFLVRATPFAYRLDKESVVRKRGIVNNRSGLEELLEPSQALEETVDLPKEN